MLARGVPHSLIPPSRPSPPSAHMHRSGHAVLRVPASVRSRWKLACPARTLLRVACLLPLRQGPVVLCRAGVAVGMDDLPDTALQLIAQHITCFPQRWHCFSTLCSLVCLTISNLRLLDTCRTHACGGQDLTTSMHPLARSPCLTVIAMRLARNLAHASGLRRFTQILLYQKDSNAGAKGIMHGR